MKFAFCLFLTSLVLLPGMAVAQEGQFSSEPSPPPLPRSAQNPLGAPNELLDDLLTNLAGQFAPALQGPFVIGLARRFRADPRITPTATTLFASACQRLLGVTV